MGMECIPRAQFHKLCIETARRRTPSKSSFVVIVLFRFIFKMFLSFLISQFHKPGKHFHSLYPLVLFVHQLAHFIYQFVQPIFTLLKALWLDNLFLIFFLIVLTRFPKGPDFNTIRRIATCVKKVKELRYTNIRQTLHRIGR